MILDRGDWDNSNSASGFKIGLISRKLQVKVFENWVISAFCTSLLSLLTFVPLIFFLCSFLNISLIFNLESPQSPPSESQP